MVPVAQGRVDLAQPVAVAGAQDAAEGVRLPVGVLVLVEVDQAVGAEVDRVGAGGEAAAVFLGVEDLRGQGLPAAGRAAVEEARPPLALAAELLLDVGDQLVGDRVAVRPEVRGVHRVGVVVIGVGVLDLDDQEAREVVGDPALVEVVRFFLLDPVVAAEVEALGVVGLEVRVRRLGAKASEVRGEVPVEDAQGVARLGVFVEALGQEHVGAEEHRPPPELAQQIALDADVLDELGVLRRLDGGDLLVERDRQDRA